MTMKQTKPMSEPMTDDQIAHAALKLATDNFTSGIEGGWRAGRAINEAIRLARESERLAREPQWVSVETLPSEQQDCVLLLHGGLTLAAMYKGNGKWLGSWDIESDLVIATVDDVTHWMQLPPKPQT